jgi:hypothetical protein
MILHHPGPDLSEALCGMEYGEGALHASGAPDVVSCARCIRIELEQKFQAQVDDLRRQVGALAMMLAEVAVESEYCIIDGQDVFRVNAENDEDYHYDQYGSYQPHYFPALSIWLGTRGLHGSSPTLNRDHLSPKIDPATVRILLTKEGFRISSSVGCMDEKGDFPEPERPNSASRWGSL